MVNEKQRKTFLSYSRADQDFAIKLAKELTSEGFSVWLNLLDVPVGSLWKREVEKALIECEIFMIILTPSAIASENVKDEIGYAIDNGKHILPLLLEKCDMPFLLRRFQNVDFTTRSFDEGFEYAKQLLRKLIAETTIPRAEEERILRSVEAGAPAKAEEEHLARQKAEAERRADELAHHLVARKAEEERLARQKAESERQAREETDKLARAQVQKEAAEREAMWLKAEREATEKVARNVAERVAKEESEKEVAEREASKLAARKEAEREAMELAARRKTEREVKEVSKRPAEEERRALEKAERDSIMKAKAERPDIQEATASPKVNRKNEVFFTAYHPTEGNIETWHTLLVYAHILSMLEKVRNDAKRFNDQIKSPKETTSKSTALLAAGTKLTIVPSCKGVSFNPDRISFRWTEDFHRSDFRFKADRSLSGDAAKGQITLYVGPLIVGTLKFAMLFNDRQSQPVSEHEENSSMYGRDDVFISYSRKDAEVARAFKTILAATGLNVFIDVDNLKSGQLWNNELLRRIERADIFQMFWSSNYSQSNNCKMEWEHALKQNKPEGYIRPVFWQQPLSPYPPEPLSKFNFQYVQLPNDTRSFIKRLLNLS